MFIKVTKTKVLAAYGQLIDVLFSQNKFPISVDPTTLPEGVAESVNVDVQKQQQEETLQQFQDMYGFSGDGRDLEPGAVSANVKEKLGPLEEDLENVQGLEEGPGQTPSSLTFHPAMVAAKKMEKKIKDQLEESAATRHLRFSCFECVTFGTGIMKGPFAFDKEYSNWNEDGEYDPILKTIPQVEYTSLWNFYPDPDAYSMYDCDYVIERHRMTRSQIRYLKKRPYFREKQLKKLLSMGQIMFASGGKMILMIIKRLKATLLTQAQTLKDSRFWSSGEQLILKLQETITWRFPMITAMKMKFKSIVGYVTERFSGLSSIRSRLKEYLILRPLMKLIHILSLVLDWLKTWTTPKP